jgi:hypothetical protein
VAHRYTAGVAHRYDAGADRDCGALGPQVIVISGSNYAQGPMAPAPGDPPDYSYVPGCHAIPNGYHCDTPRPEAPAP